MSPEAKVSQGRENALAEVRVYLFDRADYFAKIPSILWDLGLIQHLKRREEILVLLAMYRYADFKTGECAVFRSVLMREAGVKWPKEIDRIQEKIESIGAFWRAKGNSRRT